MIGSLRTYEYPDSQDWLYTLRISSWHGSRISNPCPFPLSTSWSDGWICIQFLVVPPKGTCQARHSLQCWISLSCLPRCKDRLHTRNGARFQNIMFGTTVMVCTVMFRQLFSVSVFATGAGLSSQPARVTRTNPGYPLSTGESVELDPPVFT